MCAVSCTYFCSDDLELADPPAQSAEPIADFDHKHDERDRTRDDARPQAGGAQARALRVVRRARRAATCARARPRRRGRARARAPAPAPAPRRLATAQAIVPLARARAARRPRAAATPR